MFTKTSVQQRNHNWFSRWTLRPVWQGFINLNKNYVHVSIYKHKTHLGEPYEHQYISWRPRIEIIFITKHIFVKRLPLMSLVSSIAINFPPNHLSELRIFINAFLLYFLEYYFIFSTFWYVYHLFITFPKQVII